MDIHDIIKYAIEYLRRSTIQPKPLDEYRLNGKLQYLLCRAFGRLTKEFGEVTRRDVAFLVEAWVMSASSANPRGVAIPLRLQHDPVNED